MNSINSDLRYTNQAKDEFGTWMTSHAIRNPNLEHLARDLQDFRDDDFANWFEIGLTKIVFEEDSPERAFSPGELVIGASSVDWRDEVLAVLAFLPASARANAVRGFVKCVRGISPQPQADDPNLNEGKNWEMYAIEVMRLVRELRAPLCEREATPLDMLQQLLTITFPNSQAILDEGLLLWRAFAHQMTGVEEWQRIFDLHVKFVDSYAPLVAFTLALCKPDNAFRFLAKWPRLRQYRSALATDGFGDNASKDQLEQLNEITARIVYSLRETHNSNLRYEKLFTGDPTYMLGELNTRQLPVNSRTDLELAFELAIKCEPVSSLIPNGRSGPAPESSGFLSRFIARLTGSAESLGASNG